jgi:membrane protein
MKETRKKDLDPFSFLQERIWRASPDQLRGTKRHALNCTRFAVIVVRNFIDDRCLQQASALSFTTILSFVPFLALAFSILKGFGVQNALEPLIIERLTLGSSEVVDKIISQINNTKMATVGAIGLVALLFTSISLLGSIEESFNHIWGVEETRSLYRKFSDYLSVMMSGPLLLLAAVSVTTSLQSQHLVQWLMEREYVGNVLLTLFHVIPYLSIWLALVCLYVFLPNTKVRISSAIVGGVFAGTVWQVAQWGYIHFQIGVAKNNAIYGTLAAIPVFMVWIYTSWIIVLFGVEVVAAYQNRHALLAQGEPRRLSPAAREMLALVILLAVGDSFCRESEPLTAAAISDTHHIPMRTVQEILTNLVASGYLVVAEGGNSYYPARELDRIGIRRFLHDLSHQGGAFPLRESDPVALMAAELMSRYENRDSTGLDGLTLRDAAERMGCTGSEEA